MEEKPQVPKGFMQKHRELIMYIIFGVATTLVSWAVYSVCEAWIGMGIVWSNVVANAISVLVAYVTNKLFVFKSMSWDIKLVAQEASIFIGGRLFTIVLDLLAVPWLVSIGLDQTLMGVEGLWAKIISTVVISLLNYVISKFVAFKPGQDRTRRSKGSGD